MMPKFKITSQLIFNVLCLMVICLSGCEQQKTTDYFLIHPEKIESAYEKCFHANLSNSASLPECRSLIEALPIFRNFLTEMMDDPHKFGISIMRAQLAYVQLQGLVGKGAVDQEEIRNKVKAQKREIEGRYALIRFLAKRGAE